MLHDNVGYAAGEISKGSLRRPPVGVHLRLRCSHEIVHFHVTRMTTRLRARFGERAARTTPGCTVIMQVMCFIMLLGLFASVLVRLIGCLIAIRREVLEVI